jgi:hypothetical protein
MQEAQHGTTDMAMNRTPNAGDETLLVKFYMHPRLNAQKTEEAGRPIYVEEIYIKISAPGDKESVRDRPAMQMDKDRFFEHFRRFEARESQDHVEGTMLEEWPGITRSRCEELRFLNIRTVEQLATLNDNNASGIIGIQALKQKAAKYIESADSNATAEKFAALEAKYASLVAKFEGLETEEVKPKRKRRSRAEMAEVNAAKALEAAEKAAQE